MIILIIIIMRYDNKYQSFVNNIIDLKKIILDIVLSTDQKIININKINEIFETMEDINMINQFIDNNINFINIIIDNLIVLLHYLKNLDSKNNEILYDEIIDDIKKNKNNNTKNELLLFTLKQTYMMAIMLNTIINIIKNK